LSCFYSRKAKIAIRQKNLFSGGLPYTHRPSSQFVAIKQSLAQARRASEDATDG
jgi:hypothetical protein